MKRAFYIVLSISPFAMTVMCLVWLSTQSPFAAPIVDRSIEQTRAALVRAVAGEVDLGWILPRMQDAILAEDLEQILLLLQLANDHDVQLPAPMLADINALNVAASGVFARTTACGACAVDINACATIAQIGACALPFELTPAGDVNALRRAGLMYLEGGDVDQLDVGLAIVGLGATGVVLASGGSSYTIKAGTSVLRMARRLGTLTAPMAARLGTLVGDAVRWDRMGDLTALRIGPSDMVDAAKLAELGDLGGSLRRIAQNTSLAEALLLMRHVDNAQDAARLARVTDALGPKTRGAFEVLGKTRVLRAAVRISDLALAAGVTLYLFMIQAALFCGQQCGNVCLRVAKRRLI
ncbi:hypothetical protein L0664_00985 [Octadecabacter sp. G9-8]|uniref:Uncharacterized protein n=1 Tax=Octadecabacter dasysiphoniae TaxID=2909341 RepID=A0ABS9CTT9_9RHOB|nr:hypothetical protein [Octadecabacter dasysiphoniae]MCF2869626.1 hypothetical protein [Octadecabacter dasysiphoniae]